MEDNKDKAPLDLSTGFKSEKRLTAEAKAENAVNKFVAEHLRNSSFSQDTPAWNHFQAGIPVLIGAIADELEG